VLRGADSLSRASERMNETGVKVVLVQMWDRTWYALTRDELTGLGAMQKTETAIEKAVGTDRIPPLYPDLPLDSALPYFSRWPVLPVQNRASKGTLEGILTQSDVLERYQQN